VRPTERAILSASQPCFLAISFLLAWHERRIEAIALGVKLKQNTHAMESSSLLGISVTTLIATQNT
jgi:hypothetical protein